MTVWTEDQGSTYNFLDKQVDLPAGTTYRIKNSSSTDLFTITESTGTINIGLGNISLNGDLTVKGNNIYDQSGSGGITFDGSGNISNFTITGGTVSSATISGSLTWSAAQNLNNYALTNVNIDSGNISGVTISSSLTWLSQQTIPTVFLTTVNGTPTFTGNTSFDEDIILPASSSEVRWLRYKANHSSDTNGTFHIRSENIYNETDISEPQKSSDLTLSSDGFINIYAEKWKGTDEGPIVKIYSKPDSIGETIFNAGTEVAIWAEGAPNGLSSVVSIGTKDSTIAYTGKVQISTISTVDAGSGGLANINNNPLNLDWISFYKRGYRTGSEGSYVTKGCQYIKTENLITGSTGLDSSNITTFIDDRWHMAYTSESVAAGGYYQNRWSLYSSIASDEIGTYDKRPDLSDRVKFYVDTADGDFYSAGTFRIDGEIISLAAEFTLGDPSTLGDRTVRLRNSAGDAYAGIDRSDQAFCFTNGSFPTNVDDHHFKIATDGTARFKNNVDFASTLTCNGLITGGSLSIDDLRMNNQTISTAAGDADNNHSLTISTSGPIDDIILDTQSSVFVTIGNADLFKVMRQVDDANVFSVSQAGVITLVNGEIINNTTNNQIQIESQKLKLGTSGNTVLQDNQMDVAGDWTFVGTGDINFTSDTDKHFTAVTTGTGEVQLTSAERIRIDGKTVLGDNGYLAITDNEIDVSSGDLTIDVAGDLIIDADGDNVAFKAGGNTVSSSTYSAIANTWYWYENNAGGEDSLSLAVQANGESTIQTKDVAGFQAHLNLIADGNVDISGLEIDITGTHNIDITTPKSLNIDVGSSAGGVMIDAEAGITFNNAAGFTRTTTNFNATLSTVNFKNGNKSYITLTGNITGTLKMQFPNFSGNFTLLVKQDGTGSRTIANWKSVDQSDGNEAAVVWAGGSAPTLTTTADKLDIVSFYWDNDNHIAYGVITKNF
tara:strand:+ start:8809 stop:11652 length:2844 start_codon:yes stop_codon:yes gene_type:complete